MRLLQSIFLLGFIGLGLGACEASAPIEPVSEAPRPNIVLVLFEDASPRFGAFGDELAVTPNFDRIASEGVTYPYVYTTAGVCAPSRAALISGRHQMTIGAQHMRTASIPGGPVRGPQNYYAVPPAEVKAFPELLRAGGYYTANDFKTDYQFGQPFTVWDVSAPRADWSGRDADQPFFFMISYISSHESMLWTDETIAAHPQGALLEQLTGSIRSTRRKTVDPSDVVVPPYYPDTPGVRQDIATQYDNIALTDGLLGDLYDRLEAEGVLENTILIVSTDHGDGLPRAKRSLYDSGLHVPMVIRYPDGWRAGEVDEQLISFIDLAPTILNWAGLDQPEWLHGRSFAGGGNDPVRSYIFAAQDRVDEEYSRRRAVRDHRFKYIRNFVEGDPYFQPIPFRDALISMQDLNAGNADGTLPPAAQALFEPLPEEQLYDTEADPYEIENLAELPEYEADRERLRLELAAWMSRVGDMSEMSEAEMIEAMWPGGVQPVTASPVIQMDRSGAAWRVSLASPTDGASIGYQIGDEADHWELYTGPFDVEAGATLRAKAIRYGYAESEVASQALVEAP